MHLGKRKAAQVFQHTAKEVKVKHPLDRQLLVIVEQSLSGAGEQLSGGHGVESTTPARITVVTL